MSEKYKHKDLRDYIHKLEGEIIDYSIETAVQEARESCKLLFKKFWEESVEGSDEKPDKVETKQVETKQEEGPFNESGWYCVYYAYRPNLPNRIVAIIKLKDVEIVPYEVVEIDTFNNKHYFTTGWRYKEKEDALRKLRERCDFFYMKFMRTQEELEGSPTPIITDEEFKDILKGELIKIKERK